MKYRRYAVAAIAAAFAASPAIAADESKQNSSSGASGKQTQGATAPVGAPVIVLVPVQVASRNDFSNGCWARLHDATDFQGNQLSLVGPVDMPNMRTAFGTDWSGQFDSIEVGPKARLTVYDSENYQEKSATFKPGQKVADLDEKLGMFEQVRSVKIACSGGAKTAQQDQGGAKTAQQDQGGASAGSGSEK